MAKMFYKTSEAADKLGITPDQLKELVAQGKLREFRDGPNVMFKVDQIDRLSTDKGGTRSGAHGPGASDSGLELAPSDTGASDSLNLADTSAKGVKEDTVVTGSGGSSVLDSGAVKSDSSKTGSQGDAVSLEGVGSGSGLLDLTRESDETSLGSAELLDEIYPGGEGKADSGIGSASGIFEQGAAQATGAASGLENEAAPAGAGAGPMVGAVEYVEASDASSGAFGGMTVAAVLIMILTCVAAGATAAGYVPAWVSSVAAPTNALMFGGGLLVVALLAALVGFFVAKATAR